MSVDDRARAVLYGAAMKKLLCALVACVGLSGAALAADGELVGRIAVVNGDLIIVAGQPVRIFGIDALEIEQTCSNGLVDNYPCGRFAASRLSMMTIRNEVHCQLKDGLMAVEIDPEIPIGVCYLRDIDLGEWMVRSGFAMALRSQSPDYIVFEDAAREEEIGIWAGAFIPPWDWRAGQR